MTKVSGGGSAPEGARKNFMSAMSDCGLKPTVVYHNLTPAELYEKVGPHPCLSLSSFNQSVNM